MKPEYIYLLDSLENKTPEICTFLLKPTLQPLSHQAGQYVQVTLSSGAVLPLSIANAKSKDHRLEFHLRHDPIMHPLADQLIKDLLKFKRLRFCGPFGRCTLQHVQKTAQPLLFLAGGTGFAPIQALLEAVLNTESKHLIKLYWGVKHPHEAYALTRLKQWKQQYAQFDYTIVLSEPAPTWKGAMGLVHHYCSAQHPSFAAWLVFASGPFPMIQAARTTFLSQGLLPTHFISDMT